MPKRIHGCRVWLGDRLRLAPEAARGPACASSRSLHVDLRARCARRLRPQRIERARARHEHMVVAGKTPYVELATAGSTQPTVADAVLFLPVK